MILPGLRCRPWCQEAGCQPQASRGDLDVCPLNARYFINRWNSALGKRSWRETMFRCARAAAPLLRASRGGRGVSD